jgi:hypothetical protein
MGDLSACKSKRTLIQLLTVNSAIVVIDMRHFSGVVCTQLATWSRVSARFCMGRVSRRHLLCSFRFLLRSHRAFLSSLVSSAGALVDNLSGEISSKYRSGRVPEGSGVSPAAMKTWRSRVPRPESVVSTSVGVCSSVGARGVPSWKGSKSR